MFCARLKGGEKGWITAEYALLPRSTRTRVSRETKGPSGRTHEIQRLIGRSLRAVTDLNALKDYIINIDCDVLQADGGTRTASITGSFVALYIALQKMVRDGKIACNPIKEFVAAVSCGLHGDEVLLDLLKFKVRLKASRSTKSSLKRCLLWRKTQLPI